MKKLILLWVLPGALTLHAQTIPVTFKNTIPSGYDPTSQAPGFMEVSPNITMPAGHVLVKPPTKLSYTWAQTFAKGGTHYNRMELGNEGSLATFRSTYPDDPDDFRPALRRARGMGGWV